MNYTPEQIVKLEARMQPGQQSNAGFLGKGESLLSVIDDDKKTLQNLNLTYEQFADRLETLTQKARHKASVLSKSCDYWKLIDKGIIVEDVYKVSWVSYRGYEHCPFGCADDMDTSFGIAWPEERHLTALSDTDYTITKRTQPNESIFFSQLHIHLIRYHQFFEGNTNNAIRHDDDEQTYRLDPRICAQVLDIKPNQNYAPQYTSKKYWLRQGGCITGSYKIDDYLNELKENSRFHSEEASIIKNGAPIPIKQKAKAWLKNDTLVIISDVDDESEKIYVNEIPIQSLSNGMFKYKVENVKWVEDN